jgi:ornithine carbamoyltransferase
MVMKKPRLEPSHSARRLDPQDLLWRSEFRALIAHARTLWAAQEGSPTASLLRGKNFALLRESDVGREAELFRRAVTRLGGQVAHVRPELSEASTPEEIGSTARMLGRLYDAVECQGMPSFLVENISRDAGVPVFAGVATPAHPTAELVRLLDDAMPEADRRCAILQAFLLHALA